MRLEVITRKPMVDTHPTPILFIHGAWHAAWCWERYMDYFPAQGFECHALSVRGHGNSERREGLRWHSAARGYVADVAQVAASLRKPPVLIGQSLGGYVLQKYLEKYASPAAVLVDSIPVSGIMGFLLRYAARHPLPLLKTILTLNPWHMVGTPALAHDAFFSPEVPAEEVAEYHTRMQPESFLAVPESVILALPKPAKITTPILVLAGERDRVFTIGEQQATARAYGTQAIILPRTAHDAMLEPTWEQSAGIILNWLLEKGF
jgi:pimeloyl-ACP methyl ester carboxylesterase